MTAVFDLEVDEIVGIVLGIAIQDRVRLFVICDEVRNYNTNAIPIEIYEDLLEDVGLPRSASLPCKYMAIMDLFMQVAPALALYSPRLAFELEGAQPYITDNHWCCWANFLERPDEINPNQNPDGDLSEVPTVLLRYMGCNIWHSHKIQVRFSDPDKARAALSDAILRWSLDKCRQVCLGMDMAC